MSTLLLKLKTNEFAFLFSVLFTIFSFLFFTTRQLIYLGFALISIYFFWRQKKYWILIIILFLCLLIIFFLQKPKLLTNQEVTQNFQIVQVTKNGFIVKYQRNKIFVTNFNNAFQVGDMVSITGVISPIESSSQSYFYTQKIINKIDHAEIIFLQEAQGIKANLIKFINNSPPIYRDYLSLMLLGIKNVANENIYQMTLQINVVHLFVISGFHISLLFFICQKIFNFLKIKTQVSASLALVFTLFYLYLINFPLAATRALLFLVCQTINKFYYQKKYSTLSIWAFSLVVMTLLNPYQLTNVGFVLTFGASFILYVLQELKYKSKKRQYLALNVGVYLATLPIIITLNQGLAIFGLFFSLILTPLFTLVYFLMLFLWPCKPVMMMIFQGFDLILNFCLAISLTLKIEFFNFQIVQTIYCWIYLSFIILVQWNYFTVQKII